MFLGYTDRPNFGKALFPTLPPGTVPINDAINFITAAGITNNTQQLAIINLVGDLKAYGLWDKLKAIYPFIGGTANSHKFNLKDSRDVDAAFRLSFFGGWTHDNNGVLPNGTNAYANTFLIPLNHLLNNSTHLSYYTSTSSVANTQRDIAIFINGDNPALSLGTNANSSVSDAYNYITSRASATMTTGTGLICSSRTTSNIHKIFRNGAQIGSTDTASAAGQTMPNQSLYLGAASQMPITTAIAFSTKNYRFVSIGDGLTDADAANLYTAVQAYQTTLGRQV